MVMEMMYLSKKLEKEWLWNAYASDKRDQVMFDQGKQWNESVEYKHWWCNIRNCGNDNGVESIKVYYKLDKDGNKNIWWTVPTLFKW